MLRHLVKARVASLLHFSAADTMVGTVSSGRRMPTIFGYHRVVEDVATYAGWAIAPIFTSRAMFEQHLDWITRSYRVISLDELATRLEAGEPLGRDVAALTFDDGYQDAYDYALPVLRRRGLPATVFVVAGLVGTDRVLLHDRLYLLLARGFAQWAAPVATLGRLLSTAGIRLPEGLTPDLRDPFLAVRSVLTCLSQGEGERVADALMQEVEVDPAALSAFRSCTWPMLAEMSRAGIAIGSHTLSHTLLTLESRARVWEEVTHSRRLIEEHLGQPAMYFAYPDGRFNAETVEAVCAAGYRLAFTTCQHRDPELPHLTMSRRLLWQNACTKAGGEFSPVVMSCQVNGVFDFWERCRQDHGWRTSPR